MESTTNREHTAVRRWRLVAALGLAVLVIVLGRGASGEDAPQLALIPTLVAVGTAKFFGKKKGDAHEALAEHPTVAFILGALATGNTDDAEEMVAENAAAYANGSMIIDPEAGDGPAQFRANIEFWRSRVSAFTVEVYDEVADKDGHDRLRVAARFVMSGIIATEVPPRPFEFEGAAFVDVVDGKATEWRVVLDPVFLGDLLAVLGRS